MRGRNAMMHVNTSVGRFSIVERFADDSTLGSHKYCLSSNAETGKLSSELEAILMNQPRGNAIPIKSYPQPQEPVEHQPSFRNLNIPDFFELREQSFF